LRTADPETLRAEGGRGPASSGTSSRVRADIGRHSALAVGEVLVDAAAYDAGSPNPRAVSPELYPSIPERAAGKTPNAKPGVGMGARVFRREATEARNPHAYRKIRRKFPLNQK
jgi:hypothetical protein